MAREQAGATIKDVAREAGVSVGTVSKVINGIPVGESYRIRVEKAIKKLDYSVNLCAKGLRSSRTHIIAVILPNLTNPFFAGLAGSISSQLAARNYKMMLSLTDGDTQVEQIYVTAAEQQMLSGVICLSYNPRLQPPKNIPCVSIDRYFGSRIPCVSCDNYGGGYLAAQKLAENGCTRLAFFRIGPRMPNEPDKRKDGFLRACEDMGLPCVLKLENDGAPYSVFEDFLREHRCGGGLDFDGIFCVTDYLAHQIRRTLHSMGLRVPEDVQIIGFDGIRRFGSESLYCSTIVQPVQKIAETSVDLLLEPDRSKVPSLVCLPVSYAPGGTTRE